MKNFLRLFSFTIILWLAGIQAFAAATDELGDKFLDTSPYFFVGSDTVAKDLEGHTRIAVVGDERFTRLRLLPPILPLSVKEVFIEDMIASRASLKKMPPFKTVETLHVAKLTHVTNLRRYLHIFPNIKRLIITNPRFTENFLFDSPGMQVPNFEEVRETKRAEAFAWLMREFLILVKHRIQTGQLERIEIPEKIAQHPKFTASLKTGRMSTFTQIGVDIVLDQIVDEPVIANLIFAKTAMMQTDG